jgi:hypothetical protein
MKVEGRLIPSSCISPKWQLCTCDTQQFYTCLSPGFALPGAVLSCCFSEACSSCFMSSGEIQY